MKSLLRRYRALMNFLSNVLREDGGFEYKKAIVDSILILIKDIPDAKEPGLGHLCEFIEVRQFWLRPCITAGKRDYLSFGGLAPSCGGERTLAYSLAHDGPAVSLHAVPFMVRALPCSPARFAQHASACPVTTLRA